MYITRYRITCIDLLPAHSERSFCLNDVVGDWAAVVYAGAPGQLGCAVCHVLHRHRVRGGGGAWLKHTDSEKTAHAEDAQMTALRHKDGCLHILRGKCEQPHTVIGKHIQHKL